MEINKLTSEKKINNKNTLVMETPYSSYYTYRNELKKEWKSNRIKQLEVIMSYSRVVNEFMYVALGQQGWEEEYRKIVDGLMIKYFEKNRHILSYYHKFDSTGYRYHSHTLLYPYENNDNGFPKIYNHIEPNKLKMIKDDFQKELDDLIRRKSEIIKRNVTKIINSKSKEKNNVDDEGVFELFLNKNKMIRKLFL